MVHADWRALAVELVAEAGSQSALARQIGVTPQTVQRWCSGETTMPDVPHIRALAAHSHYSLPYMIGVAYGMPIAELAFGAGSDLLPHDHVLASSDRAAIATIYRTLARKAADMPREPIGTGGDDEAMIEGILALWRELAGSDDPAVVLRWVAERSWDYRRDHPEWGAEWSRRYEERREEH